MRSSSSLRVLLSLLSLSACSKLPPAPPHPLAAAPPKTSPVLQLCWLETAGTSAPAAAAAEGWVRASTWEVTTSALLVRHPAGDFLIDTGLALDPEHEAKELSPWGRFIFAQTAGRNRRRGDLRALLASVGVDPAKLKGIILSHAHTDHAGGVAQLPGVPVYVAREELEFVRNAQASHLQAVIPAQARELLPRMRSIPFAERSFASYQRSWDVFGDGALVVVPTFGHTPGSVGTFASVGKRRLFHVGDLISVQESLERNVPKSRIMRALTDEDAKATDAQVAKLVQLHAEDPELWMLPAHDRGAWAAFFGGVPASGTARCVSGP